MAIQSAPFYWVTCDVAGCKSEIEYDEVSAWANEASAIEVATEYEWLIVGDKHYCPEHTTSCEQCGEIVMLDALTDDLCTECQAKELAAFRGETS
jgi:hypothetical protein